MPFQKGNKLSVGRPVGARSLITLEKKGMLEFLKDEGAERFIEELKKLEGEAYCKAFIPVVELVFPKLSRTEVTGKDGKDLTVGLTETQEERIFERLKNKYLPKKE